MTMNDDDEFSLLRRVFRKPRLQMIDDNRGVDEDGQAWLSA